MEGNVLQASRRVLGRANRCAAIYRKWTVICRYRIKWITTGAGQ
jgi:hypothetical protein